MEIDGLLPYVAAVLGFVAVGGVGWAFVGDSDSAAKASKRLGQMKTENNDPVKNKNSPENQAQRRKQLLTTIKAQEREERRVKLTLEARLTRAGLSLSVRNFWIGSGALGAVACVLAYLLRTPPLIALGIGAVVALGLPRWLIGVLAQGRAKKFTEDFPNAIDVITRGIKSGLPVNDCLRLIGQESPEPLATEFKKLTESVRGGLSIEQGLEKMYARMPTSEVRFFGIVLSIQQKTGGNLAEALSNLSTVLRSRKLLREKIKALSGEAVASAFIIGSLPPGIGTLVSFMQPSYMAPLLQTPRGHVIIAIAVITEAVGVFVMRRMINFKF